MSDWNAESLRVTAFTKPDSPAKLSGETIRRAIAHGEPDRSVKDSRTLSSEDGGPWQDAWLTVRLTPGRVDVVLTPVPVELLPEPPSGIPHLGRFDERLVLLDQAGASLLGGVPGTVVRLAVGAVLMIPAADRDESYALLKRCLHTVTMDPGMEELVYQVNRPLQVPLRPNGAETIKMNRLAKWSAIRATYALVVLGPGGVPLITPPAQAVTVGHACRAELDLSTDGERGEALPADSLAPLLQNMFKFSVDLAEHGEVGQS